MVKYFKDVFGDCGQVHVCNSNDLSVAFQYADKSFISPLIYDEKYIPHLLEYCKENKIEVLVFLILTCPCWREIEKNLRKSVQV